ncbi:hypothetical protein SLA_4038 [Streptomyces laurentii]|uniref:Uncharacterized protein n=1 Tax=Streptomyces laurentii TaxID=39478 RepID=A0A160P0N9_STRLU|nr:hypothetical protein SLA_4038 [Streptomyces laurentii]
MVTATSTPPGLPPVARGFLLEVVRYASEGDGRAVPVRVPRVFDGSRDALREIRAQVRGSEVFDMTARDIARVNAELASGRRVALGLLDAGIPVGFTVSLENGTVAEWSVRPVRLLVLPAPHVRRHTPQPTGQ